MILVQEREMKAKFTLEAIQRYWEDNVVAKASSGKQLLPKAG
jgi:hypothetical protein